MYKGKRILGIIPARSGSKGLPDKNIRRFCGKPLLGHAIEVALRADMLDALIVSTDSNQYADIARQYGASVPFMRPARLATDSSLASEYIEYTLQELKKAGQEYDYFVLLQPTSPLRTARHICDGIMMAIEENLLSVVAVSKAEHPPQYCHMLPDDFSLGKLAELKEQNRQEHIQYYRINGLLYVCDCDFYLGGKSFYSDRSKALLIDNKYAIDIDTEDDFLMAEYLYRNSVVKEAATI